ncbi:MAG TPA: SusC/RagA family TonB-linked outer membrane protein [Gemmatimonadaceae bacterium]|nr:SusC/RagA family TonB-linked outer membrane protein [Gemmatimonadaceae bacterium]
MVNRFTRVLFAGAVAATLVAGLSVRAAAQGATVISGRVVGEGSTPIANALVLLEATSLGAQSDQDGRFSISVPANRRGAQIVSVRAIGYKMKEDTVQLAGAPITVNFTLSMVATQLQGVTVTALSIQREKATIGTSQQTVGGEDLTRVTNPNLISALSGKVSGVQINQSGNMGGSSRIVIRGAGSILGENQPLFVVDGVPILNTGFSTASASSGRDYGSAISDLNPDDIESVNVLKGPNAAALYGSRASNGAIVITTKSGRNAPSGTQFSFTSRATAEGLSIFPKYQNRYGQGFVGEFEYLDGQGGGTNDGADESWGPRLDGQLINQFNGLNLPWVAHPDNVRNYFRTGNVFSNTLNVVSNGPGYGARVSLTKESATGIVPNSSLSKLVGSVSANAAVKDKLMLSGSLQYVQSRGQGRNENGYTEGNPWMSFTWFGRQVDLEPMKNQYYNLNSPYGLPDGSLFGWNYNYHRNPYWQVYENPTIDTRDRVIAQISGNYQFTPWLSGLVRAGADGFRFTADEHLAAENIDRVDPAYNGGFTSNTNRAREINLEGILTARKSIQDFDLTFNFGGNKRRNHAYNNRVATTGILVPKIYNLANAGIAPTVTNSEFHSAVNSMYGSAIATYKGYWTVEVTGRNDWSSTLPKDNASYFYPSISTSLILSDMLPSITGNGEGAVTYLKVRGGVAQVGADAAPYQLATLFNGSSNKFDGLPLYSLSNTSANAFLKPERTTGAEIGAELSLFRDRITLDATYYTKKTKDQIINLTTAPATGFSATAINAGQISNKGVEMLITARPIVRPDGINWTTSFNFTKNKNRVDELAPGLTATNITGGQWSVNLQARVGQPYGVLFGPATLRDPATGQLLLDNGLPQRDPTQKILGNVNPDWVGGWFNEVRYKNYTLSALLDIRVGGENFSIGNMWGTYAGILESTLRGRDVDWDDPGVIVQGIDEATGQPNTISVTAEDYNHNIYYEGRERAIFSTGFTKLRELRLSWEAPSSVAQRLRLAQFNVSFVGRNLLTWTDFPNYDPENSTNATNGGQGFDMGAMPTTRSIGLHVRITP